MRCGLISEERYKKFIGKRESVERELERLKKVSIKPIDEVNEILERNGSTRIDVSVKLIELLRRTEIKYEDFAEIDIDRPVLNKQEIEQIDIQIKYEGYIKLQLGQVERFKKLENKKLPEDMNYTKLKGISIEGQQKLDKHKPVSIGQASRISGVSPADITVLLIYLEQRGRKDGD